MTYINFNFRKMTEKEIDFWYNTEMKEAFKADEIKPLPDILKLMDDDLYDVYGAFSFQKNMIGYVSIWKTPNSTAVLLDYLGVTKTMRNYGLGTNIISLIGDLYRRQPILVESELPDDSSSCEDNNLRNRRISFYERSGFKKTYTMATCGLLWQAFVKFGENCELHDIIAAHRAIYGQNRSDVKIPADNKTTITKPYWS